MNTYQAKADHGANVGECGLEEVEILGKIVTSRVRKQRLDEEH